MMSRSIDLGSTIRQSDIRATLAKLMPICDKVGITRIANVTGLDHIGIPVAVCIRPNAKHLSVSQGKGISWELAQVSAVMESLESYHLENVRPAELCGSYDDLNRRGTNILDPLLVASGFFQPIDLQLKELEWLSAMDLSNNDTIFIPRCLSDLNTSKPQPQYAYFKVTTNGMGAGNTLEEATTHALSESIERECIYHWLQQSEEENQQCKIDIKTVDHPVPLGVINRLIENDMVVHVWSVGQKDCLPAFCCVIQDKSIESTLGNFFGSGAHFCKRIALTRALTEAVQARLTYISGSRDDVMPHTYKDQLMFYKFKESNGANYTKINELDQSLGFIDMNRLIVNKLNGMGFKHIIRVDHTKKQLKVPVVQIIIPGMRDKHGAG